MTVYLAFRCPPDLAKALKANAKSQRRSLSNYIVCGLYEKVKKDNSSKET